MNYILSGTRGSFLADSPRAIQAAARQFVGHVSPAVGGGAATLRLSDEDIERIAKRVAELLAAKAP